MEDFETIGNLYCKKCEKQIYKIKEGTNINYSNIQIDQIEEKVVKKIFKIIKNNIYRDDLFCKNCENLLAIFYKFKNNKNRIVFLKDNISVERPDDIFEKNLDFLKYQNYSMQYLIIKKKEIDDLLAKEIIPTSIKFIQLKEKIHKINNLLSEIKKKIKYLVELKEKFS